MTTDQGGYWENFTFISREQTLWTCESGSL